MNLSLATLALRRTATLAFAAFVTAVLTWAALADWQPASDLIGSSVIARAPLAREGVWTIGLIALAPWLVFASAATIPRWRERDVDWLAQAPISRWNKLFSTWCGLAAACALTTVAIAVAAEFAAQGGERAWRIVAEDGAPRAAITSTKTSLGWRAETPASLPANARVRIGITKFAGAPAAELVLSAERKSDDGAIVRTSVSRLVAASTALELDVPRGEGPIDIELRRVGDGAIVALDGSGIAWLAPLVSARWISADLAWSAWLALASACALALGLGAWLSRFTAAALVCVLALVSWLSDAPQLAGALPWLQLPRAIDFAGRGLGFATPSGAQVACVGAFVLVGIVLAATSPAAWRRTT